MFGLSSVLDIRDSKLSVMDNIEIPMLRSLAKIEVVNKAPEDYVQITGCRLTKYNANGRFIPNGVDNPSWNEDDVQVTSPSLPQNVSLKDENLHFVKSSDGKTLTAYIPEMLLSDDNRPELEIDVNVNGSKTSYKVQLASYDAGIAGEKYASLLRNHRYGFTVTSVGLETDLKLIIDTQVWEDYEDQEWTYDEAKVEFAERGEFTWTTASFEEQEPAAQRTLLVTTDGGAEASFTMTEPAKGSWTIMLVTDDQTKNNAFRIDLWNAENSTWEPGSDTVIGSVGEGEVKIRISATGINETSDAYTARLIMTAVTFDGRIVQVNLPKDASDNTDYYTIKQYKNF